MNLMFNRLNELSAILPVTPQARSRVLAAGVAMALSRMLPLPSGEVVDPSSHYNLQLSTLTTGPLSRVNEAVVFDMKFALELTRVFWTLRYSAAFGCRQFLFPEAARYGFFDTVMGAGLFVSEEVHAFCNEHKASILRITAVVKELFEGEAKEVSNVHQ